MGKTWEVKTSSSFRNGSHPNSKVATENVVRTFGGGWVIFRAETVSDALMYYQGLGNFSTDLAWPDPLQEAWNRQSQLCLLLGSSIILLPGKINLGRYLDWSNSQWAAGLKFAIATLGFPMALLLTISNQFSAFLYFQF